jgi:short-subunit dehydrogenase involved in D-alanine esterification of teichoic acids
MKLTGNTIFITGGGSGIGRGLAEALHKLGNKVIVAGRRRSHLDAVIAANHGMEAVELDISDPASIERVAAKLVADHPELNVLINNAGVMQPDAVDGMIDDALMISHVTTNLIGPIRMTSALIDHLKKRRRGGLHHVRPGLRANGGDSGLLIDEGCTALLCIVTTLHAAGHDGSRAGDRATLGAY